MKERLFREKLVKYLIFIFPGILLYYLLPCLKAIESEMMLVVTTRLCIVYIIGCVLFAVNSLLLMLLSRVMKGLIQIFQIILFFVGGILMVSILINKSPTALFAGLGASAAVLMLIFKDTILGFVAGVQLSANDMLRIGDWIQLPNGAANGIVREITLHTVKVQNWDNTVSTIPPYTLVNTVFTNWRGMQESGGRRVDKTILLDMNTLKFCSPQLMEHIRRNIPLMKDEKNVVDTQLTNVRLYRLYIERYLRLHPIVNADLDLVVTLKEPSQYGLPIEVYFFLSDKEWKEYEQIQSDIFEHLLVMAKEFDLKLHQLMLG